MTDPRPAVAVVVFPGSNDDRDAAWALGALDAHPALVWHEEERLPPDTCAVVLPGGAPSTNAGFSVAATLMDYKWRDCPAMVTGNWTMGGPVNADLWILEELYLGG